MRIFELGQVRFGTVRHARFKAGISQSTQQINHEADAYQGRRTQEPTFVAGFGLSLPLNQLIGQVTIFEFLHPTIDRVGDPFLYAWIQRRGNRRKNVRHRRCGECLGKLGDRLAVVDEYAVPSLAWSHEPLHEVVGECEVVGLDGFPIAGDDRGEGQHLIGEDTPIGQHHEAI